MTFDVVVPTVGRNSLRLLLADLWPARTVPHRGGSWSWTTGGTGPGRCRWAGSPGCQVIEGRGAGPAAARNLGWRRATAEWVAFLDDDVVPGPSWLADLAHDLEGLEAEVAASQGRVRVPMPAGRRPTDWERNVRGLETARWATADMAYRRSVLEEVGGFDERFPRAYREDADLGLRVVRSGYRIVPGRRVVTHPVRVAGGTVSLRVQAGNADDALMRGVHGRGWRASAGVPRGRRARHLAVTGAGLVGLGAWVVARRARRGLGGSRGWPAPGGWRGRWSWRWLGSFQGLGRPVRSRR